jgi:hypothetical protein
MKTEELLVEREKTHGPYREKAKIIQRLKKILREHPGWPNLNDMERESLEMIVHKIGRVMTGDPHHKDHWADISGYAALVVNNGAK